MFLTNSHSPARHAQMQRHTNISARLRNVLLGLAIVIAPLSAPLMGSAALAATSATVSVDTAVTRGALTPIGTSRDR